MQHTLRRITSPWPFTSDNHALSSLVVFQCARQIQAYIAGIAPDIDSPRNRKAEHSFSRVALGATLSGRGLRSAWDQLKLAMQRAGPETKDGGWVCNPYTLNLGLSCILTWIKTSTLVLA